jgi:hypothetical protein
MSETNEKRKIIKEILARSNAHAVPRLIVIKNKYLKILWLFFFLVAIGGCVYFLVRTFSAYLSFTTSTNIDLVIDQPAIFPTVTICNTKNQGLPLNKITYCQINYDSNCQNNLNKYFEYFNDSYYGQCLRFNSGKDLNGNLTNLMQGYYGGSNDGLWLNFKIDSNDKFNKLLVIIHNHTTPPLNMANEDLKISPGRTNYITVDRTFRQKLSEPYSNCIKDSNKFKKNKTLIDYLAKSGREYSQKQCFELCFNLKYFETNPCNCTFNPWDQVFEKCYVSVKKFTALFNCSEKFRIDFSHNYSFKQECIDYCPVECDTIAYSFSTYTLEYPVSGNISIEDKSKFDSNFNTYEEVQKNFYSLVIYYKDLKYTLLKDEPNMILADLISNIGGLLGVFIGYSFVSFIEIFEILFAFIFYLKKRFK